MAYGTRRFNAAITRAELNQPNYLYSFNSPQGPFYTPRSP